MVITVFTQVFKRFSLRWSRHGLYRQPGDNQSRGPDRGQVGRVHHWRQVRVIHRELEGHVRVGRARQTGKRRATRRYESRVRRLHRSVETAGGVLTERIDYCVLGFNLSLPH